MLSGRKGRTSPWDDEHDFVDSEETDPFSVEPPGLFACYQAAASGIAVSGERAGQPVLRLIAGGRAEPESSRDTKPSTEPVAEALGVNLYAKQLVDGRDWHKLERLCRYVMRPPLSQERLHWQSDGRLELELKNVRSIGGSPNAGAGGYGGTEPDTVVCRSEKQVSTAAEIVAEVVALGSSWKIARLEKAALLPVTDDLRATVDITLDPQAIPVPGCQDAGQSCTASFGGGDVAGLVSDGQGQLILQAGAAIRLRPYLYDMHPVSSAWYPVVQILPPCSEPCGADERRCPKDTVCYLAGERFCLCCGMAQPQVCACESPQIVDYPQTAADQCDYSLSPDTGFLGTCQDGKCVFVDA